MNEVDARLVEVFGGGWPNDWLQMAVDVDAENKRLKAEGERLQDALLKYGHHLDDCVFYQDDDSDLEAYGPSGCCTCGFDDASHPD